MIRLLIILICLLTVGCSGLAFNSKIPSFAHDKQHALPSPDRLKQNILVSQLFHAKYQNHVIDALFAIEVNENMVKIVGLSVMGMQLFTITYSEGKIAFSQKKNIAADIPYEQILSGFILTFWPIDALQSAGLVIQESRTEPFQRTIWSNDSKIIDIKYETMDPWKGAIQFTDLRQEYSFVIETVMVNNL